MVIFSASLAGAVKEGRGRGRGREGEREGEREREGEGDMMDGMLMLAVYTVELF